MRYQENFLGAGISALLMSVARLDLEHGLVSLFALVRFLWQAVRVGLLQWAILKAILATSFVEDDKGSYEVYWGLELERHWCYFAHTRAPPLSSVSRR
ncbi:MAG: hypothetical protein GTO29_08845 [Candidatus Latescibacteria bacterium]|nr:hypothetical protein [Candidatus Latescibacterota bacterium]NIO56270.1 hypothetical protein [Candidatus Latescibacterota bacterium]